MTERSRAPRLRRGRLALAELPLHPAGLPGYRAAVEVVRRLRKAGHAAYLVGGGVRDLVMGFAPKDFDIVTSATPDQTQALFSRSIPIGAQFGVVTVLHRGLSFEVATFRAEGDYRDGRRPDWVRFADLESDLARRDFTINSLVLDPDEEEVLDWCGGLADMRRGVVRTIGDPQARFQEDALRMLRAVRFAARFGYRLERATRGAVVAAADTITRVATERIWQELEAMWSDANRSVALALLRDTGLLVRVVPTLAHLASGRGETEHLWTRTLRRIEALPKDTPGEVAWACLLADAVCPEEPPRERWDGDGPYALEEARAAEEIMTRLRAPRKLIRSVGGLLARRWVWYRAHDLRYGSLARSIRRDTNGCLLLLWKADAAGLGRADVVLVVEKIAEDLRVSGKMLDGPNPPPVTGDRLLARGMEPGPHIQELLAEGERLWLEGGLDTEEQLGAWLEALGGSAR